MCVLGISTFKYVLKEGDVTFFLHHPWKTPSYGIEMGLWDTNHQEEKGHNVILPQLHWDEG